MLLFVSPIRSPAFVRVMRASLSSFFHPCMQQSNYNTCTMFKTLGPSAIDVEMRLMAPYGIAEEAAYNEEIGKHGSTSVLKLALWFFVLALEHGGDFDIIQA